jgi:hypothetical protein
MLYFDLPAAIEDEYCPTSPRLERPNKNTTPLPIPEQGPSGSRICRRTNRTPRRSWRVLFGTVLATTHAEMEEQREDDLLVQTRKAGSRSRGRWP